jgi:ribonuclease Z
VKTKFLIVFMGGVATTFLYLSLLGAGGVVKSPTGVAPDRYVYYPGTEELAKNEIRLIACGTGLPAARRDQQATCWLADRKTV